MKRIISGLLVMICLISCLSIGANASYDTIGKSRNADLGTTYYGTLSSNNPHDYYKFTLPSSGRVDFTFTANAESTVYVDLYDSNREQVDTIGICPLEQLGYCFEKCSGYFTKGEFYLCIDSLDSDIRYGNYEIETSFTPANESFSETINNNDNVIGRSHKIELNTKVYGQLGYSDSVDFYTINVPSNGEITFNATAFAESTMYVKIYDKNFDDVEELGIYPEEKLGYSYCKERLNLSPGEYYVAFESLNSLIRVGFYNFIIDYKATIPKPSGLKCTSRSMTSEKVSWNKVSGASGYQVQISTSDASKWAQAKTGSANNATFIGLVSGGKYKFRVRAYKYIDGTKKYSAWSKALSSCTTPATVKIKSVSSPKKTQIKTTWKKAGGVVSGYQIVYSRNMTFTNIAARKNVSGKATISYTGKNFTKGKTYYVAVRAYTSFSGKVYYGKYSFIKAVRSR